MAVVLDGSELNQERIDEIIKIGEMAEMEGIEPGYLINSKFQLCPIVTARPFFIYFSFSH